MNVFVSFDRNDFVSHRPKRCEQCLLIGTENVMNGLKMRILDRFYFITYTLEEYFSIFSIISYLIRSR